MCKKVLGIFLMVWSLGLPIGSRAQAQQASDMVVYNAKIITVDDYSFTSNLGTVAEAMHIRDGKVLHVGDNAQIRSMAGPDTQIMDLKGRTVIPGIILTHEHPWDWNPVEPWVVKEVLTDDIIVTRFLEGSPEENLQAFPGVLAEAVAKARPGQWIYIVFTLGKNYEYSRTGNGGFGRAGLDPEVFNALERITREQLDAAAPNNPVVLRDVFTSMVLNQRAADESRKVFTEPDVNPSESETQTGSAVGNPNNFRWFIGDVMLRDYHTQLVEIMRLGLEWWAGYGMTGFSSNAYTPSNLAVYAELDRKGQMPVRTVWSWNWRQPYFYADSYFLHSLALSVGKGTDYVWFGGGRAVTGGGCTTLEPVPSSTLVDVENLQMSDRRQQCNYGPDTPGSKLLYEWIKAGGRYVGNHTSGDMDVDSIMLVIEQASKAAGMTYEEIRAKRHAIDHMVLWPRRDQIDHLKRLGIIASGDSFEIIQSTPAVFDIYGERGISQVVPKRRVIEAGVPTTAEIDRAIGSTDFTIFSAGIAPMIERRGWDGKVYGADQAVDRQTALKSATYWGAYYLLREDVLGTLEPGKWADFLVLDRDYLTIPAEEIKNIRVLMTVLGGKTIHLVPSLAREVGMQPAGAQVTLGGPASQW